MQKWGEENILKPAVSKDILYAITCGNSVFGT